MSPQLASVLAQFIQVLMYIVIARALLSWFIHDPENPLMKLLSSITDPVMAPISRYTSFGGFDVSPIIVYGILYLIRGAILRSAGLVG